MVSEGLTSAPALVPLACAHQHTVREDYDWDWGAASLEEDMWAQVNAMDLA